MLETLAIIFFVPIIAIFSTIVAILILLLIGALLDALFFK